MNVGGSTPCEHADLPAARGERADACHSDPSKELLDPSSILLVEDNDTYAVLVRRLLDASAAERWELYRARSLADAREWLLANRADCILLDLGLPDAKGLQSVSGVHSVASELPIVVLSGLDDEQMAIASLKHGVQDYLNKAMIDAPSLRRAIRYAAERKRSELAIQHRAEHDPLTGLVNRTVFMDRLKVALARLARLESEVAVLFIDLDRFKSINDTLGHEAGDELLVEVAHRLLSVLRAGDVAARMGGDEFLVLVDNVSGPLDALTVADRLHGSLGAPFHVGDTEIPLSASIGISQTADPSADPLRLIWQADVALYHAKALGKSRTEIFDASLGDHARARARMQTDLHRAIEQRELLVHYQPVVDLRSGGIASAEALVRWRQPSGELVGPGDFIHMAEETGIIAEVEERVLREACAQLKTWDEENLPVPFVSVNLSPLDTCDPTFTGRLATILDETGVDPTRLSLEITEKAILADEQGTWESLERLGALGVTLSLDDFGAEYSSLSHLRSRVFDVLKLDSAFAAGGGSGSGSAAVLETVVGLARAMNIQVVAKGIETPAQADRLRSLGCDLGQGYLFAKPGPALESVPAYLGCGTNRM